MRGKRISLAACGLAILALAGAPAATAWEWVYGPATSFDAGARGVAPVPSCGTYGPGYIAVGTRGAGAAADVYVVFTDAFGAAVPPTGWEATYDVWGGGFPDEGVAIVPVPGAGYVFLSNTLSAVWRPALTFVDCGGAVLWSRIYYDLAAGYDLRGKDLIRTQSGDPAFLTAPGDFAVAGVWWNGGNEDAFLMRTNAGGNVIWNVAHNTNFPEAFHALAEALPAGTALTGDLVAVGRWSDYLGEQDGLLARVDGNTGNIGPLPQCLQRHGQAGSAEVYNSVTRLQRAFPGQFAMVGTTTGTAWLDDIWVTRGNPCNTLTQSRLGDPGGSPTSEHGNDIVEILAPKPTGGYLAIAGDHGPAVGGPYDAALLVLDFGLMPTPGASRLFGGLGPHQETFVSLAEDPATWPVPPQGYILAGSTRTPWGGDPQDLYLVHDDPAATACGTAWAPFHVKTLWPRTSLLSYPVSPARDFTLIQIAAYPTTGLQTCP